MSRRLKDRRTCEVCGHVVDRTDDGTEVGHAGAGHAGPPGPPAIPEAPEPAAEPDGAAEAALTGADDPATLPPG